MGAQNSPKPFEPIVAATAELKGTVLIVDDNADIVEIIKSSLESLTLFKVLTAANGREGLEVLNQHSIDVIVLDDHMPEMGGAEFFRIIRQRSIYVPVIFLTGLPDNNTKQQQLSLGAFDYLAKPVKAQDLILLVTEASKVMDRIRAILERRA